MQAENKPSSATSCASHCYLDFYAVHLQSGQWQVSSPKHEPFLFCGTGSSLMEAIGKMIVSNRETLGIQFTVREQDGTIKPSTVHGRGRTKDELGPSEQVVLDWDSSR